MLLYETFVYSYIIFTYSPLAEAQGFEPWDPFLDRWFSRPVHSTALPNLHKVGVASYPNYQITSSLRFLQHQYEHEMHPALNPQDTEPSSHNADEPHLAVPEPP